MPDDTTAPFLFPATVRKKVTAAFDGGRITSDGGVILLVAAERRLGIADRFAGLIADPRNPALVTHSIADILRARTLTIACGYEDADQRMMPMLPPGSCNLDRNAPAAAQQAVQVRRGALPPAASSKYVPAPGAACSARRRASISW